MQSLLNNSNVITQNRFGVPSVFLAAIELEESIKPGLVSVQPRRFLKVFHLIIEVFPQVHDQQLVTQSGNFLEHFNQFYYCLEPF